MRWLLLEPAAYAASGAAFGYWWPEGGWRWGVCLFAFWAPALLFALFLSGEALVDGPVDWRGMLQDLAGYSLFLVAACLGAEIGAIIGRRRGRQLAAAKD